MQAVETSLAGVLAFEHSGLVTRLREKLGMSDDEATLLFEDTKRFLYLCGTVPGPLAPPEPIDECWHQFILFTKDYARFCERFFGHFVHHVPKSAAEVAVSDGQAIRRALSHAKEHFGPTLSSNWTQLAEKNGENCNPSTSTCDVDPCTSDGKVVPLQDSTLVS